MQPFCPGLAVETLSEITWLTSRKEMKKILGKWEASPITRKWFKWSTHKFRTTFMSLVFFPVKNPSGFFLLSLPCYNQNKSADHSGLHMLLVLMQVITERCRQNNVRTKTCCNPPNKSPRQQSQASDFGCLGPGWVLWPGNAWETPIQTGHKHVYIQIATVMSIA